MRTDLAKRLLGKVMGWNGTRLEEEMDFLDFLSELKYDHYQQFALGMRFVESLALWLNQFDLPAEKETAYLFVKERLVFISEKEMRRLVEMSFPDVIRPILLERASVETGIERHRVKTIAESDAYERLCRECLYLGLSDGARTDVLRRSNPSTISNEHVWQAYELSRDKAANMLEKLRKHHNDQKACFQMLWLLDDFSGSGKSCIRRDPVKSSVIYRMFSFIARMIRMPGLSELVIENDKIVWEGVSWEGKIPKTYKQFYSPFGGTAYKAINQETASVFFVLYCATTTAVEYMEAECKDFIDAIRKRYLKPNIPYPTIKVIHLLDEKVSLSNTNLADQGFLAIVDNDQYYDHDECYTDHFKVGGTNDAKRGFSAACLPLVLSHNTPNNSVALLWSSSSNPKGRGLFPRVSRHRGAT